MKFQLPAKIARGDGLLTILVEDGGVTESIQKRIPIVMKTLQLAVFPEGGDLVEDVPGRVYFMAKTTIGKPADIEGKVVDDRGQGRPTFSSVHDGMGRFELTPAPAAVPRRDHEAGGDHHEVRRSRRRRPTAACSARRSEQRRDQLRIAAICTTTRTVWSRPRCARSGSPAARSRSRPASRR